MTWWPGLAYLAVISGTAAALSAPQDEPTGRADYDRVCKVCHGADAIGDAGPRLVPFTRDYDELLAIVREGAGQMPPISARQLDDDGVARILSYLRSLSLP